MLVCFESFFLLPTLPIPSLWQRLVSVSLASRRCYCMFEAHLCIFLGFLILPADEGILWYGFCDSAQDVFFGCRTWIPLPPQQDFPQLSQCSWLLLLLYLLLCTPHTSSFLLFHHTKLLYWPCLRLVKCLRTDFQIALWSLCWLMSTWAGTESWGCGSQLCFTLWFTS